jgi:hypothetical protein
MLRADLFLENAVIYGIEKIDIRKGEDFRIELAGDTVPVRWFSDNDSVLRIVQDKDSLGATFKATAVGSSEIRITVGDITVKRIFVEVYQLLASNLGITWQEEVPK